MTFAVGADEKKLLWRDGEASSVELGSVSVFDAASAQVYVASKTEVAFRPFGLDVMDRLAAACATVKARLEKEQGALQRETAEWPTVPVGSAAAKFLASLSALTPAHEVERVASLTAEETEELKGLIAVLSTAKLDDPLKRSGELKMRAGRVTKLVEHVRTVSRALGPDAARQLDRSRQDAVESQEAADLANKAFDSDSLLSGVGSSVWRQFWEAARAYSQRDAYPGQEFPYTAEGSRCVLCQQELASDARRRLATFESFVQGEAQRRANEAAGKLAAMTRALEELRIEAADHIVDELVASVPEVGDEVRVFLKNAAQSRARAVAALTRPGEPLLPLEGAPPLERLQSLASDISAQSEELLHAADPEKRRTMEARLSELEARRKLEQVKPVIFAEIARRARINAYEKALKDTATTGITRQSTDLTKKYVTDALAAGFEQELKKFGFQQPELVLKPVGGQRGALYHQIQLKHATRAELPKIMSEGEARCLALAAFLAEVRSAGNLSGIIFDDPVSSLDHRWRSRMARRLVAEARARQVVVFTHELVFLYELVDAAEREGVPCACRTVLRVRAIAGRVESDLPWDARSTNKRIGALRQMLQRAEKVLKDEGQQAYELQAVRVYALLRRAWERAVEEVLLNGVVERFRDSVQTQRLKRAADLTPADYEAVEAGMAKCSKWEGGHDHALALNEPVPLPDEIETDLKALETFVSGITKRRK
jgi:hypothetical protein